ncbi:MAG TPA: ImmA/IrrE family metallo-endopeptidase [Cyclobacteriaceae bacterium]|nr:ImmA/IrrE family metallo-endopeptidase [Cyclobacteriaceae bacterium]
MEEILGIEGWTPFHKGLPLRSAKDANEFAMKLKWGWRLGSVPISNLIEVLEDRHIKVFEIESDDSFDGVLAWANDNAVPFIVLNSRKLKSSDRKRFTALREVGYLLMNFEGLNENQKEEYCNHFASIMLFSELTLYDEFNEGRSTILLPELGSIKQQYGISIQDILFRLKDARIISESYFEEFQVASNSFEHDIEEAFPYYGQERSGRFQRLLFRALGQGQVSISKAAALNNQKVAEFRAEYLTIK